jgi:AraC family transcriptional regulator
MNSAVERAAKFIWEHYSEPLSLADIARSASLSRFHLCRIFRAATRVSPCRFLSAVRIYQAKQMLLATSVNITDISFAVGYNSVGSFTNYFTTSVGVSPRVFRRMARDGGFGFPGPAAGAPSARGAVCGTISLPDGYATARVYLGIFASAVVQQQPSAAVVVDIPDGRRPPPYHLPYVPRGKWFIHAVGVADSTDPQPWTRRTALVGTHSPVSVTGGTVAHATMSLRPRRMTDPPVLLALPDLEAWMAGSRSSGGSSEARPISSRPDVLAAMESRPRRRLSGTPNSANGRA